MKNMNQIVLKVKLPSVKESSYPIILDDRGFSGLQNFISAHTKAKKLLIVTDSNVFRLYKKDMGLKNADIITIEAGEENKNLETYSKILQKAEEMKLERKDAIVAFGGGIVGDIAGFAASTHLRGVDFVQVPTTLLAQVDSSVGGKVAINTKFGKNLIGSFYQPKLVFINPKTLDTLDERQFKTGLAEVIKYALIEKTINKSSENLLFNYLSKNKEKIYEKEPQILREIIKKCCELKAEVVFQDEKEAGMRAILNFGHTFCHAIEKCTNYKTFTHGEALAIGLKMALELSFAKSLINEEYLNESINLIDHFELIYDLPKTLQVSDLVESMRLDKKVEDDKIKFVLSTNKAEVGFFKDIDLADIEKVLKVFL